MKKRLSMIPAILLSLIMLIGPACSAPKNGSPASPLPQGTFGPDAAQEPGEEPDGSDAFDPETDFDNRFGNPAMDISHVETEDAIYWHTPNENYLYYYDKAAGDCGVLCPRPECLHDRIEENRDCTGYMAGSDETGFSFYGGRLYWVALDWSSGAYCLFSIAPDGTDKSLVKRFDAELEDFDPLVCAIHRGRLYITCIMQRVTDAEPKNELTVYSTGLDEGSPMTVIHREENNGSCQCFMRFIGRFVYFAVTVSGDENGSACIYRLDTESGHVEEIWSAELGDKYAANLWVERDGSCYILLNVTGQAAEILRITNGRAEEPIPLGSIADGRKHNWFLIGGATVEVVRTDFSGIDEFIVRDLSGSVIFEGKPSLGFIEEYRENGELMFYPGAYPWGDGSRFYFAFILFGKPDPQSEERSLGEYIIGYEVTEEGLKETLIGIDKWVG